jgi:two-component system OmpR family sensor kinase/two-component system sensor histidine kinase BaeS
MKLTVKVLIAQLIAITIALTMTALLIEWRAGVAYRGYFNEMQAAQLTALAEQVAVQYAAVGDWQSVQNWLTQYSPAMPGRHGMGMGQGTMAARALGPAFLVVDPQSGEPLGQPAAAVSASMLATGAPVVIEGATKALLISEQTSGQMGRPEQNLLAQVQSAILVSALVSGVIALGIGALLVAGVLRPLRAVERAVTTVSEGNFAARVGVTGEDEIASLGRAFNHMAEVLEAQEMLRQRLVSDVAHELRTPISVIQGNLQAILDGVYPLNHEEIQTLLAETQLLSRLVTDLHELAQAETGRLALHRQPLPVAGVLVHLADLYAPVAEQKGIDLQVDPPATALYVDADPDRLQQILHNLLGNALRHTPSGESIRIAATADGAAGRRDVRFTVQDTGTGVAPDNLPFVFERFYRGDASRLRPADHAAGAGLGLAIAKALVQSQGGQIGAYATIPHGASFWFTLPATSPT